MVSANPKALTTYLLGELKKQQKDECHQLMKKTGFVTQLLATHSFPALETINEYLLAIPRLSAPVVQNGKSRVSKLCLQEHLSA